MGKLIALGVIVLLLTAVAIGGVVWWSDRGASHALAGAEKTAGAATVSAGQADVRTQALKITVAGAARDAQAAQIHTENQDAILQAPGAAAALDPGFVARLNDGLCKYQSARSDPGCAGLLSPDPSIVSSPGSFGPAP